MEEEQNPYRAHLYRRKKTNEKKHTKITQNRTRCCLSHIINWPATNPAVGHKIEEVTPKPTGNEHGRRKTKQNKQTGKKQTAGRGRRESSLQRTSSPGRGSGWKTKKQKRNKQGTTTNNTRRARKATIKAVQDNPDRKTRTRTTSAPHSEIKMKEERKGDSNKIEQGMR